MNAHNSEFRSRYYDTLAKTGYDLSLVWDTSQPARILADLVGVSNGSVSRWRYTGVPESRIKAVADALGLDHSDCWIPDEDERSMPLPGYSVEENEKYERIMEIGSSR